MAADLVIKFSKNRDLFTKLQKDPMSAIAELEKKTKSSFANVRVSDLQIIMGLSPEELDLLAKINTKAKAKGQSLKIGK